jgi:hypothetical protein
VFPKLFHFFNKFVSAMLERDGHETDKRLTFSISLSFDSDNSQVLATLALRSVFQTVGLTTDYLQNKRKNYLKVKTVNFEKFLMPKSIIKFK